MLAPRYFGCSGAALGYLSYPRLKSIRRSAGDLGFAWCLRASVVKNKPSNQSALPMPASLTPAACVAVAVSADMADL